MDRHDETTRPFGELLWSHPADASKATLILAHGAGAPMDSEFMQQMAALLASQGVTVARFEFPYMNRTRQDGVRRPPDRQQALLDCWRVVHADVRRQVEGPLAIGGKSMGGRMASLVADELGVDALVCLGYPFHAIGKADRPRVEHLRDLRTPTLIIQGERDPMGSRGTVALYSLSAAIRLEWLETADHDLKPLKSSGFTHEQHLRGAAVDVAAFINARNEHT